MGGARVQAAQRRSSLILGPDESSPRTGLSSAAPAAVLRDDASALDSASAPSSRTLTGDGSALLDPATQAFELAYLRSRMEHPLCAECARIVLGRVRRQVAEARQLRDSYVSYLRQAVADDEAGPSDDSHAAELEMLQNTADALRMDIDAMDKEQVQLTSALAALREDEAALDAMEEAYWADYNAFMAEIEQVVCEREAVRRATDYAQDTLRMLRASNVLNDAFHIWHDGPFGTINGLRLGRTSGARCGRGGGRRVGGAAVRAVVA